MFGKTDLRDSSFIDETCRHKEVKQITSRILQRQTKKGMHEKVLMWPKIVLDFIFWAISWLLLLQLPIIRRLGRGQGKDAERFKETRPNALVFAWKRFKKGFVCFPRIIPGQELGCTIMGLVKHGETKSTPSYLLHKSGCNPGCNFTKNGIPRKVFLFLVLLFFKIDHWLCGFFSAFGQSRD